MASQLAIYAEGRQFDATTNTWTEVNPHAIRTKAKPGTSAHNVITRTGGMAALALDVIPLNDDGQPLWTIDDLFWQSLYELAWDCGLDPLGDPILAGDKGHFEEPGWRLKLDGLGLLIPATETVHV
jgi:hypothetical protein